MMSRTVSFVDELQLEVRPQTRATGMSRSVNDKFYAMERLKYYIRDHALNIEDVINFHKWIVIFGNLQLGFWEDE